MGDRASGRTPFPAQPGEFTFPGECELGKEALDV
jgi:hypothetical protein